MPDGHRTGCTCQASARAIRPSSASGRKRIDIEPDVSWQRFDVHDLPWLGRRRLQSRNAAKQRSLALLLHCASEHRKIIYNSTSVRNQATEVPKNHADSPILTVAWSTVCCKCGLVASGRVGPRLGLPRCQNIFKSSQERRTLTPSAHL